MVYDVIVLGGGPAGYTAALYAARAGLSCLVLERISVGGQMSLTDRIDNYPGFPDGVDGFTLGESMKAAAEKAGAQTLMTEVLEVQLFGHRKSVKTDSGAYDARSVIVATGAGHKHLGLPEEEDLVGRGVHYCATCDGMFYRNKTVAVVGGGNTAVGAANYLAGLCKKVILVHRRDSLRADRVGREALKRHENVEIMWKREPVAFVHERRVTGLRLRPTDGGAEETVACDGVFISVGQQPNTELFRGVLETDEGGYLLAGEDTRTNLAGVFAAGDVRTKPLRQIVTACADGATAAMQAQAWLLAQKEEL